MIRSDIHRSFCERFADTPVEIIPSMDDIASAEQTLNTRFPQALRDFLLVHGCVWCPNLLDKIVEEDAELSDISSFLTPEEIIETSKDYQSAGMPEGFVCFCTDSMGNITGVRL